MFSTKANALFHNFSENDPDTQKIFMGGCRSGGRANHLLIVTLAGRSNIPGKHTIPKLNVCKCEMHLQGKSARMNGRMRQVV